MHSVRAIVFIFMGIGACLTRGAEVTNKWSFEGAEVTWSRDTGIFSSTNRFTATYGDVRMSADRGTVNQTTGDALVEGHIRIERADQIWEGEKVEFNFMTGKLAAESFRTGQTPFFVEGDVVSGEQKAGVYVGINSRVTTDDYARPGYSIRAKTIVVVPGDYIEARSATLYMGKVPVFYFPYFRRSLRHHSNYWVIVPGYRSLDGPYLLTSYNWYWNEQLGGAVHIDGRAKRGVGVGPDLDWHLPRFGDGKAGYYYIHDVDPGEDAFGQPIGSDRQRAFFTHFAEPITNLTARLAVRYQSDARITHDFFESEYRENVQPSSFLEVNQLWSNVSVDLLAHPQVNPFFETVERLPDVKVTAFRQQIGPTPIYYESESSAGYYRRSFADGTTNSFPFGMTNDYAAARADTFHQLVMPLTVFGWLNLAPRVGGRFTHYTEANGRGATTDEEDRAVFNTGAELSLKASRLWPGAQSKFWEINGLRHIVEPSFNYVFVPHPTRSPRELPQFDYELPSPRLLPIDFPDYNAIDSIDAQNVVRLGLRNKLQTKRHDVLQNMVNWALYTDWRLNPRRDQGTFADVFSDLDLRPFSWLLMSSEVRYDVEEGRLDIADHRGIIAPNDVWSVSLGHRYVRDDPVFGVGNNLFITTIYYRLNENWATRISHHFEARDGTMEEQYYTVYRDLRSWTAALTLRVRDQRTGPMDFTVAFTASLKASPRFALGTDRVKPSMLLGY
jgi:lipopolysaccharide assembly outer membrane protein LptD (OstA)